VLNPLDLCEGWCAPLAPWRDEDWSGGERERERERREREARYTRLRALRAREREVGILLAALLGGIPGACSESSQFVFRLC